MQTNHVPKMSPDNPTGCCPRFLPKEWDGKKLVFDKKPFVRVVSRSLFYIPLNLGSVMKKTMAAIVAASADNKNEFVMLSLDLSPWRCEHLLSVTKKVPGVENVTLSGVYQTKVFEGPYQDAPKWIAKMGGGKVYLYYTTCPKCAKFYGKNYVVAIKKV